MSKNFIRLVKGTWVNLGYIKWIGIAQDDKDGIYVYAFDDNGIRNVIASGFSDKELAQEYLDILMEKN